MECTEMRLQDFAEQSRYLNWSEKDTYDIALAVTFDEFVDLAPTSSEKFDSEQYEIPIFVIDGKESFPTIIATKSKVLLSEFISLWSENQSYILRVNKKGSGFYTKYNVINSNKIYDIASGKISKNPAKK